ncbi:NVEALA domain-containing protein [uncultured Phocaeicola sp.]|uniref:NVEALA domain-containing protein n=1 Tax=uncultured Phocaeicola sp. TaxID=990718 RepID=UPI0025974B7F|nr:NVEALA domain-containing protein [uncultured Phocaeicola sp.]
MKKIMVLSFIFVTLGISFYLNCNKMAFNGNLSDLQIANIEALAGRESGVSNTGPAEEKKCYGGGHKMVCRCINSQPCTGTDCY